MFYPHYPSLPPTLTSFYPSYFVLPSLPLLLRQLTPHYPPKRCKSFERNQLKTVQFPPPPILQITGEKNRHGDRGTPVLT